MFFAVLGMPRWRAVGMGRRTAGVGRSGNNFHLYTFGMMVVVIGHYRGSDCRADGARLLSEVIRIRGRLADLQVFEETRGLRVGDRRALVETRVAQLAEVLRFEVVYVDVVGVDVARIVEVEEVPPAEEGSRRQEQQQVGDVDDAIDDAAHQRVSVAVAATRRQAEDGIALTDARAVDELLALHLLEVREIEAQALGLHQRALLPDVLAQDAAQGRVQQVGGGVVARGSLSFAGIDLCPHCGFRCVETTGALRVVEELLRQAQEEYDKAVAQFRRAIRIQPSYHKARFNWATTESNLARIARLRGNLPDYTLHFERALPLYDEAISFNPRYYKAYEARASLLLSRRLPGEAVAAYELAARWAGDLPYREVPTEFIVYKPLEKVPEGEVVSLVLMLVKPDQLSALVTLAGFRRGAIDATVSPWGAACQSILFAHAEAESECLVCHAWSLSIRECVY